MGKADMNQDADKLRSALHEVFTKIDEEYDRHTCSPLQLSGACSRLGTRADDR